jgi:hypothetical protein
MWCSSPQFTKLPKFLLFQKNNKKNLKNPEAIFNPDPEPRIKCQSRWVLITTYPESLCADLTLSVNT